MRVFEHVCISCPPGVELIHHSGSRAFSGGFSSAIFQPEAGQAGSILAVIRATMATEYAPDTQRAVAVLLGDLPGVGSEFEDFNVELPDPAQHRSKN